MRPILLSLFTCLSAAAAAQDDAALITYGSVRHQGWRLNAGLAAPLDHIEIKQIESADEEPRNESLDLDHDHGWHLDGERQWSRMYHNRLGYVNALGLALDQHLGSSPSGHDYTLWSLNGFWRGGLLMRIDSTNSRSAHQWLQFELTPYAGLGLGMVEVEGGKNSDPGLVLEYGLLFNTSGAIGSHFEWQVGLGAGGAEALVQWENTDWSEASAVGLIARFGAGYRF